MPFRPLYMGAEDDSVNLIIPQAFNAAVENNIFDSAFNDGMDLERWDDWMKWEGANTANITVPPVPIIPRRQSTTSSISSSDTWMDQETADMNQISDSYTNDNGDNGFPFSDTSYNFLLPEDANSTRPGPITRASNSALFQPQQDMRRSIRGYSSLTAAEERDLQDIAMPYHNHSNIKIIPSAPASESSRSRSPSSEPEKQARKTRKRKSTTDEGAPSALCLSRKRGHNAIEKRYRTNLNDKINLLREALPTLQRNMSNESKDCNDDEIEGSDNEDSKANAQKCGKAATLTLALDYIKHLELAAQRLGNETGALQRRIGAFEKLAMSGNGLRGAPMSIMQPTASVRKIGETLESIQADFPQLKPKSASGSSKRRGSRQGKVS